VTSAPLTQGRKVRQASTGYVQYINYNAITLPAINNSNGAVQRTFGNMSRNPGRTPAFYQTDLDLNKRFNTPIEGMHVEFRSELYNIFNHTNLYLPSNSPGGTQGGTPTTNGFITSTFTPRVIQFALKVVY